MSNCIDVLIQRLRELSPMPSDDSPQMTLERLISYGEIIHLIDKIVHGSETGGDPQFIKPLIDSFGYGDAYEVYWTVIHILEKYPLDHLRPALREAVEMGEPGARMWCTYMLGRQRNSEDVPLLIAALQDSEYKVRYNTLTALAMIGDLAAKPAMEALLNDPVEQVRKGAREYVRKLSIRAKPAT